jgi:hypothetical protein
MKKDNRRRLVGALGGAGGALVLGTMLSIVIFPDGWGLEWSWKMALFFEIIGIFLIIMAVYVDLREEMRRFK